MTLLPSSFVDRNQDIYEPIRQRLPNVRYLDIGGGGHGKHPSSTKTTFARFIESQPLVEHFSEHVVCGAFAHRPRKPPEPAHPRGFSLYSASSIVLGRHITHLKINSNAHNMNNATHWSNLLNMDSEALQNVVVFAADFIKFDDLVKLVARMPNLERLQLTASPASRVQWLSKLAALSAPKLRHLCFDAPWLPYGGDPSRYYGGVRSAFDAMPGLSCISVGTGLNPTFPHPPIEYDFFFRAIPAVRLRYRHRHPSPSPWWEDWEADYDAVPVDD